MTLRVARATVFSLLRRCASSMLVSTLNMENRPTPTASRINDPATSSTSLFFVESVIGVPSSAASVPAL